MFKIILGAMLFFIVLAVLWVVDGYDYDRTVNYDPGVVYKIDKF